MSWHDLGFHGRYDGARTGQCSTRYAHVSCMPCMPVYYRGGVHKLRNTTGSALAYIAQIGCAHVSPEVLARFGSSIASMKALYHAHVPRLVIFWHDAREANERRWCL